MNIKLFFRGKPSFECEHSVKHSTLWLFIVEFELNFGHSVIIRQLLFVYFCNFENGLGANTGMIDPYSPH